MAFCRFDLLERGWTDDLSSNISVSEIIWRGEDTATPGRSSIGKKRGSSKSRANSITTTSCRD
jgi:hypothetical protein